MMALDEPQGNDNVFDTNGISFIINNKLFEDVKPVYVDYVTSERGSGFSIKADLKADSSCGSCCAC
jgi:Fe-S cluster assembly iron-binding protein IscA